MLSESPPPKVLSVIRSSLTLKIYFKKLRCCRHSFIYSAVSKLPHTHTHCHHGDCFTQTVFTLSRADNFTHIRLCTHTKFRFCTVSVTPEIEKLIIEKTTQHQSQGKNMHLVLKHGGKTVFHVKTLNNWNLFLNTNLTKLKTKPPLDSVYSKSRH